MIILKLIMALCMTSTAYAGDVKYTKYPNGLLKTKTYASGFTVSLKYAKNGKVSEISKSNGTKIVYLYDGKKNLTQVQRSDGLILNLTYDKKGRIASIYNTDTDTNMRVIYESKFGKPSVIIVDNLNPLVITYDPRGHIKTVVSASGVVAGLQIAIVFRKLLNVVDPKQFMAEE